MAPLITHLVIGERVFAQIQHFDPTPAVYGAFLLGCVLVDVNNLSNIDRRQTHFVGRWDEGGEDVFGKSCANFLSQLNTLLSRPWDDLAGTEQAFVAGYLCHLAADEFWREFGWSLAQKLGIASLTDLPVPGEVIMTAVNVLSREMFVGFSSVASALNNASIPTVLTHVPHDDFQRMWDIIQAHQSESGAIELYFKVLEHKGKTSSEIQSVRQQHDAYWEKAVAFIRDAGGIESYVQPAIERAAYVVSQLWTKEEITQRCYTAHQKPLSQNHKHGIVT